MTTHEKVQPNFEVSHHDNDVHENGSVGTGLFYDGSTSNWVDGQTKA